MTLAYIFPKITKKTATKRVALGNSLFVVVDCCNKMKLFFDIVQYFHYTASCFGD